MLSNEDGKTLFDRPARTARAILSSPTAYGAIFLLAALISVTGSEIGGAVLFSYVVALYMIVFDDLISSMLPFLLTLTFTLKCYDSFDTFWSYRWFFMPALAAIVFHFVRYKKPFSLGENFSGVCAVAAAVTLGGLNSISAEEYFRPASIYHVFSLGIGMILGYLLIRSSLSGRPIRESARRFAVFMYLWGLFAAFMVIYFVASNWASVADTGELPYFQWSNNISTVLMLALPFPFYFSLENPRHLPLGYAMYISILLSSSRGGALFGTVEMIIITVYVIFTAKSRATRMSAIFVSVAAVAVIYKNLLGLTDTLGLSTVLRPEMLITSNEPRLVLLRRSIEDLRSNLLFGRGLGYSGNADVYDPKKGAMYFYHMMIPQILGSMGLFGAVCYLWQFFVRIRTAVRRISPYTLCLFISYLGIFMMSQVNPGEFVPIPYSLVTVALFIVMECLPEAERA